MVRDDWGQVMQRFLSYIKVCALYSEVDKKQLKGFKNGVKESYKHTEKNHTGYNLRNIF